MNFKIQLSMTSAQAMRLLFMELAAQTEEKELIMTHMILAW